ncbi:uncharacterized protein Tco025E_04060 [Trypanosoma conorhini]|uniref:Uncharacterized protein n=1 Tax=Trypanosoma conorhini TaxID=83891 RepID=A0A422PQ24_9TRYP|nr:uncharacterized protein Tco025E_04060 [Trypanosoma conorhini]RNF19821.1 hypothetical protein Tco025E_04060 [Trypanosoma conorhini]
MFKRLSVSRFCFPTRVIFASMPGATPESTSLDGLEAAVRAFAQSGRHQDPDTLKLLLDELIQSSDPRKVRLCKEACRLSHAAGHHARCAELFFSCRSLAPLPLSDTVVNAAALTTDPEYLQKCVSTLEVAGGDQGPLSRDSIPLLLLRIYWQSTRCFMQLERSCPSETSRKNGVVAAGAVDEVETERVEDLTRLAQYRAICEETFRLLRLPGEVSFEGWWSRSKRLVLYHAADEGEADVYEQHFSWWERHLGARSGGWLTPACFVAMLRSCLKAERWDFASRYAALAESCFLAGHNPPDDALLQQLLAFFVASMQGAQGAALLRRIRQLCPDYTPSIAAVQSAARVAGHAVDEELAVWCLQALLSEGQPVPPSSQDIFVCLIALAKCRATNFKKLLHALEESCIIALSEEERLYLDLLFARRSVFWREEFGERVEHLLTQGKGGTSRAALSVRNFTSLLYLLQEGEDPGFMNYYVALGSELQTREMQPTKAQWVAIALKWAASQPALEQRDYKLLVNEAHALLDASADASSPVLLSHALKSKLHTRLGAIEQLRGKGGEVKAAGPHNAGDISLARFVRQRHRLPRVHPPSAETAASPGTKLWQASDTLAALSQREWRAVIQRCR